MKITLKVEVANSEKRVLDGALAILESIKNDHPDLFQQAEMVIKV